MVYPPEREMIHSLKLVDYLLVQADKPWYSYNIVLTTNEPWRSGTNEVECAPYEDSRQPMHLTSLIRVLAVGLEVA